MNAPRLWELRQECLTVIGKGPIVFVAAFPILMKFYSNESESLVPALPKAQ
jgi:hypothetical protein